MLRITDILDMAADGGAIWTLRAEARLKGDRVRDSRRSWRRDVVVYQAHT